MDPHPGIRHKLVRLMVENPPFERAHKHRLDKPDLVDRIWNLIKYDNFLIILFMRKCYFSFMSINIYNFICSGMLSHDAKLRCDLVDLYYTLYGTKMPFCLPIPEIVAITKPRKAGPPTPEREVRLICITFII